MCSLSRRPSGCRLDEIAVQPQAAGADRVASLVFFSSRTMKAMFLAFGLGVVSASGWLIAASQGILEKSVELTYAQPAEKSLLVFHIIEQFGGASKSLMQFLILANRTGRRPVLPGVAERGITDRTIYRSADRSNVEDLDQFLDLGSLTLDPGLPARGFREHIKEKGKILDAVVFIVLNPFSEATFQPLESKECGSGVHGDVDPLPPEAAALWRILHVDLRHAWPGFLGVGARGQGLVRT